MSNEDIFVTWKDFSITLEGLNTRHTKSLDELRSLFVTMNNNNDSASRARHESTSAQLQGQNIKAEANHEKVMLTIGEHKKEDQEVANRVLKLEEGTKRMAWVFGVAIPSVVAGWELLKAKFFS